MRDASLDEFFSTDEGTEEPEGEAEEDEDGADEFGTEQSGSESEPGPEGSDETEPSPDPGKGTGTERDPDAESEPEGPPPVDEVEPARSTFAWSPDGVACAECGERVEERWESDAGLVCVGCKVW